MIRLIICCFFYFLFKTKLIYWTHLTILWLSFLLFKSEYTEAVRYIELQFLSSRVGSNLIYIHHTCATDTNNVSAVFSACSDAILNLQEPNSQHFLRIFLLVTYKSPKLKLGYSGPKRCSVTQPWMAGRTVWVLPTFYYLKTFVL